MTPSDDPGQPETRPAPPGDDATRTRWPAETMDAFVPDEDSSFFRLSPEPPTDPDRTAFTLPLPAADAARRTVAAALPEPPPARLGRFEILREIGSGGFGVVYLALDPSLRRLVALKVPRPEVLLTPALRQRFLREGQIAADLDHPNVVQVHEAGEADGTCYIASAYCPGPTLAQWLRQHQGRSVDCRAAAGLLAAVADAVHYAHQRGVIHRDLKPANVLLGNPKSEIRNPNQTSEVKPESSNPPEPTSLRFSDSDLGLVSDSGYQVSDFVPKVSDFGLAKLLAPPPGDGGDTVSGALLGTPAYMAPEQAAGRTRDISTATDVYALGVILYECLTGRTPFRETDPAALLQRVTREAPTPARRLRADVPRDLETICLKCLVKEPAGRYASAGELADDLRRWLAGRPVLARRHGPLERLRLWCRREPRQAAATLFAAAALLALVVGGIVFLVHSAEMRGELRAQHDRLTAEQERRRAADELASALEFHRLLTQARERRATRPLGWTWDNLDDLTRAAALPPAGERRAELRSQVAACLAAPDLRRRAVVETGFSSFQAVFSPDGKRLALAQGISGLDMPMQVRLADPATGKLQPPLWFPTDAAWQKKHKKAEAARALAFSPDGRWLVVGTRSGRLHRWDLTANDPKAATWAAHSEFVHRLAFADGGAALYSLARGGELKRWDVAGGWRETPTGLPAPKGGWTDLAALPGRGVALVGESQLRILQDGRPPLLGPPVSAHDTEVCVRPDAGAFALVHDRKMRLYAANGGHLLATFDGAPAWNFQSDQMAFSPDGRLLAASAAQPQRLQVWETTGGRLVVDVPLPGVGRALAFSPDGRTLAVAAKGQTYLNDVACAAEQQTAAVHDGPVQRAAFADAGGTLACLAEWPRGAGKNEVTVWAAGGRAAAARRVVAVPQRGEARLAVGADRRLYYNAGAELCRWDLDGPRRLAWGALPEARGLAFGRAPAALWAAGHDTLFAAGPGGGFEKVYQNADVAGRAPPPFASLAVSEGAKAGRWVVAGRDDGRVLLIDATTAKLAAQRSVDVLPVAAAAVSPDDTLALVGTEMGNARLLSLPSLDPVKDLRPHADAVTAVAFLPGSGLVATASRDRTVRLSRLDGEELLTLPAGGAVRSLSSCPDGVRLAVVVEGERAVRVWDLGLLARRLASMKLPLGVPHLDRPPAPRPATFLPPPAVEPPGQE